MSVRWPIVYGIVLGDEERYGRLDENGNFQELEDPISGPEGELAPLIGKIALELPCTAEIVDPAGREVAVLDIGVIAGKIACTLIMARPGHELTGQLLRQAPIAALIRNAATARIVHLRDGFAVRFPQGNPLFSRRNEVPNTSKRRTLDDEFLLGIADVYRGALASGNSPAIAVERAFGPTTPENARRWIMTARKAGFLGESLGQGRKGEIIPRNHPTGRENSARTHRSRPMV